MTDLIEQLSRVPKVSLHDHLDGGLRASTVAQIAAEVGHRLPAAPEQLADWFFQAADSGNLVQYLETFDHTLACMQRRPDVVRVAREFVEDLAADAVVYAEIRWAPEQHLCDGLTLVGAIEAVRDGLAEGMAAAAASGRRVVARQILTAMRHGNRAHEIAELAVRYRDQGVAGFDIAGAERGFPPTLHIEAFRYLKQNNAYFTIHAGEAFGLPSIWEAVQLCGANRLGHGVRLMEDIDTTGERPVLGPLAAYIRNERIPLELCPSSNLQTGICDSIAAHPLKTLADLKFRVTVNCDNRLMSRTTLTREFALLCEAYGWGLEQVCWLTINAAKSAFWSFDERLAMIEDVIKPGFAAVASFGGAVQPR